MLTTKKDKEKFYKKLKSWSDSANRSATIEITADAAIIKIMLAKHHKMFSVYAPPAILYHPHDWLVVKGFLEKLRDKVALTICDSKFIGDMGK